ncbi:hypothetical protein BKI52_22420 [marine bacterium AO1-C]|nr:hypothetical protein BKI52_22420 [marine bacterium AO1-C]
MHKIVQIALITLLIINANTLVKAQIESTSSTVTFDLSKINAKKVAKIQWLSPTQKDQQQTVQRTIFPVSVRIKSFSDLQRVKIHMSSNARTQILEVSNRLRKEQGSQIFYVLSVETQLDPGSNSIKIEVINQAGSIFSDMVTITCNPPQVVKATNANLVAKKSNSSPKSYQPSDVDEDLPSTHLNNPNAIAVVIGNTHYKKAKNVNYAIHDAQSIKKYLEKVMGFKPGNIFYLEDATKGEFELYFGIKGNPKGKLYNAVKPGKSDVFVFYSGHGAPSIKNKHPYFVPVECDPQYIELGGYSANVFYQNLAKVKARSIAVVLDACFSGSTIYENISLIDIKPKGVSDLKNGVVLSSSSGNEVSCWYNDKQHGLFTYFFLKAIHNQNADANQDGQLTFREIYQYISNNSEGIPYFARRIHGVEQHPTIKGKNTSQVLVKYD